MVSLSYFFNFLIILAALTSPVYSQSQLLPCALQWKTYTSGEKFPQDVVQLTERFFIAGTSRSFSGSNVGMYVGMADNTTKKASFYYSTDLSTSFYVLTNPNDCAVSWVDAPFGDIPEPDYALSVGNGRYVAMRKSEGVILGGTLQRADISQFFAMDPNTMERKSFISCEALKSTENLRMIITNLNFTEPLTNQPADFMGLDTIENDSPSEVEHRVTHETSVILRYEIQEAHSFAQSTHTVNDFSLSIPGLPSLSINWENKHDSASGSLTSIVKETEESVKSSRTIIVPPFTNLQACSILFNAKQEAMPYTGQAAFSITGRNSDYVRSIILHEGYVDSEILYSNGTHVFVRINGAFSIESPLRTKLFVHEVGDPEGCESMQGTLHQLKRLKNFHPESKLEISDLETKFKKLAKEA